MDRESMRAAWDMFDRGDVGQLRAATLEAMLAEAEAGERYLVGRGDALLVFKVRLDINRLRDVLRARGVAEKGHREAVARERRQLREEYGRDADSLCGLPPGKYPALEREGELRRQERLEESARRRAKL